LGGVIKRRKGKNREKKQLGVIKPQKNRGLIKKAASYEDVAVKPADPKNQLWSKKKGGCRDPRIKVFYRPKRDAQFGFFGKRLGVQGICVSPLGVKKNFFGLWEIIPGPLKDSPNIPLGKKRNPN